jgi:hypothetical protein
MEEQVVVEARVEAVGAGLAPAWPSRAGGRSAGA